MIPRNVRDKLQVHVVLDIENASRDRRYRDA